ncbi:uncharacterized protein LOC132313247 isoform X2 [Cornus florida]|uniref:uncharacterized protein LOC132313247 isoform X2 n=1 Tax=Cornus florida TaxID=4283 RepID=UPI0028A2A0AB|nr:uncharacterized protein LOC132313247 isoform X2 [Cornus florida]
MYMCVNIDIVNSVYKECELYRNHSRIRVPLFEDFKQSKDETSQTQENRCSFQGFRLNLQLTLEKVIGLTTKNANGLDASILNSKSVCVYIAGCVVVIYNVDSGIQSHLMVSNRMPKPLSCVAISRDGNFVAAGESGHRPAVLIWDSATLAFVSELKGHQYGVACIAFSPDGKQLVSVGFPLDAYICLWDWRSGMLVAKVKACSSCSPVASVSFSSDSKLIVTAGKKHLKVWTFGSSTRHPTNARARSLTMQGKSINLGHQKGYSFVAVTSSILSDSHLDYCDQTGDFLPIYALTDAGLLCVLHSRLSIKKSVDLKVEKSFALSTSNKLVACACNGGVVKLFTIESLKYAGSLQYTEAKNCNNVNDMDCHTKFREKGSQSLPTFPDAIACQFSTSENLVVVYGDRSVYIWEIHDLYKATRRCVLVSHGACIWDIKNILCENMHDPSIACVARGCSGGVSFATCSSDDTIRLWDFALQPVSSSKDGLTLAMDPNFMKTEAVGMACLVSAGIFELDSVESGISTQGFRSMAVSPDGKQLAVGDCRGNLHIYNLHTSDYICFKNAHDAEILSLSFSLPRKKDASSEKVLEANYFLASGGRDRVIRLYDVKRNFDLIGCVDDHSAAVTSVKLICNDCKILSCSADRSLVYHDVAIRDNNCKISRCHHQIASSGTVYDMAVDPLVEVAITVGQDKKINIFKLAAGKLIRSFKLDGDSGDPVKVTLDPSCSYLVCSYSNRSICMYDFFTGEMVARAVGHGEVINGVIFLPDCKHIVSVGGDGCIFIWKMPVALSSRMLQRIKERSGPLTPTCKTQSVALSSIKFHEKSNQVDQKFIFQEGSPWEPSSFKFSISRLPKWAQAKVTSPEIILTDSKNTTLQKVAPEVLTPLGGNDGGYASLSPEVQTPSKHDLEGSKLLFSGISSSSSGIDDSQGSVMPQNNFCFTMDKRWLTIHTVCLDLLNSPEVWDMTDRKVPVSFPNLLQDPAVETSNTNVNNPSLETTFGFVGNNGKSLGVTFVEQTRLNTPGFKCNKTNQYGITNASACREVVVREVTEQMNSGTTESGLQPMVDAYASHMKSSEDDMFNLNLHNLSAGLKNGRTSSARRCHSARMRRDLRGQKEHFDTPNRDFGGETINLGEGAAPHGTSKDPAMRMPEESRRMDTRTQVLKLSTQDLLCSNHNISRSDSNECPVKDISVNEEVIKAREQEECNAEEIEKQQIISACREALLNLDAAADSALLLFSELGSMASRQEILRGPGGQLHEEATEMLPTIAKKVHAVARLAQSTSISSGGKTRVDNSSFEPLLGTFAETISQRVVEILKKNCSSV